MCVEVLVVFWWPLLCFKVGVFVGGPSCASNLGWVWGAFLVPQTWCLFGGTLLVPQTWCVCGGPFLCLKLGVCVGVPFLCLKLGVCVWVALIVPHPVCVCGAVSYTHCCDHETVQVLLCLLLP